MTVQEIIEHDRDVLADTADQVEAAKDVIRELAQRDPERVWLKRELQEAAAEGHDWSSSVVSLALWGLVDSGELVIDDGLKVHAVALAS